MIRFLFRGLTGLILLFSIGPAPAWALPVSNAGKNHAGIATPQSLGRFGAWYAATHQEAAHLACYAFAYPSRSHPTWPGRGRVVLSVTQRPGERDSVALTAGYDYPPDAAPVLRTGKQVFTLYTARDSAFAQDGRAVVQALIHQALMHMGSATVRSPVLHHGDVTDTFDLHGFSAAYAAIGTACPA